MPGKKLSRLTALTGRNLISTCNTHFQSIFLETLHKHAPIKKKILRFNDNPFMTKALRKAIMHRSKLKNIFHKTRAKEDWNNYKKKELLCKSSSQYKERLLSKTQYKKI